MMLRFARMVVVSAGLLAAFHGGCAKAPPAVQTEYVHDPAEPAYARSLTSAEQRQVEQAFGSLIEGKTALHRPIAAEGVRWSDMPAAVVYACDDIEAAVVRQTEHDWGWEFAIRTVEDWPGLLTVRRTADQRGYEAAAVIGVYGDRKDRAQALLDALDKQLHAFSRKRRLPD